MPCPWIPRMTATPPEAYLPIMYLPITCGDACLWAAWPAGNACAVGSKRITGILEGHGDEALWS